METAPNFDLAATVRCGSADLAKCQIDTIRRLRGIATLRPRFDRIHLVGADSAFQVAGFTVRAEAAYGVDRRLPRPAADLFSIEALRTTIRSGEIARLLVRLPMGKSTSIPLKDLFVTRDVLEWGIGIDTVYEGWMPLLQVNQTLVLNNHTMLLVDDTDTRVMFVLRKSFLNDNLHSELVAAQGVPRSYTIGLARATYAVTDNLRVRVGFLLLAGSGNTLVGQYHSNDEAFVQLRYSY